MPVYLFRLFLKHKRAMAHHVMESRQKMAWDNLPSAFVVPMKRHVCPHNTTIAVNVNQDFGD